MKLIFCASSLNLSDTGGMNKVIYYALPEFCKQEVDCLIVSGNNVISLIKSIIKISFKNPLSYNTIVFNSLAAVSKKYNRYWMVFFLLSALFRWQRVIYWHEMSQYFENFSKLKPKEAIRIIKCFNRKNIIHLAVSNANSKIIDDYFPLGIKRIVYNTCNPKITRSKNKFLYPTVLTIGSIQYIKGTDIWTKVAIGVCQKDPYIHFLWCGGILDNKLYEECREMILDFNLEDRIEFLGYISNPNILIHASHLFYLPSRCDSMPLVVLEAMAHGKNIIYYDSGGVKEAVGDYGIFIENFNIESTINKILKYFNGIKDLTNAPENVIVKERFSSLFSPKVFVQRFLNILDG